jgi:hypothetical protein
VSAEHPTPSPLDAPALAPTGVLARGELLFLALAVLIPTAIALFTGHVWEDFFITFRHSENLAAGEGLLFQPGERVHGFTSPLGVLLPALCHLLSGQTSWLVALWLFRILCVAAYAGGGLLLLRAAKDGGSPRVGVVLLGALYLFEAKSVTFTISGMETALMLLCLAWGLRLLLTDLSRRWLAVGLCWAALMWTRPDSCMYIGALMLTHLAFPVTTRRETFQGLLKAAGVCTLVYLPWFLGAWIYYGSPVPHTVLAKSAMGLSTVVGHPLDLIVGRATHVYSPAYSGFGGWPSVVHLLSLAMTAFAASYWLIPGQKHDRPGRMGSVAFALVYLYFLVMPFAYPWYFPPLGLLGLFVLARGLPSLSERLPTPWPQRVLGAVALPIVLAMASMLALQTYELRVQQAEIEVGVRTRVGRWLAERVQPEERVFLEPLGYIGYFSKAHMLDYPGLATPQVARLRRERKLSMGGALGALRPEWVVLRTRNVTKVFGDSGIASQYELAFEVDATPRLDAYAYLPGKGYLYYDARFQVFRRLP